MKKILKKVKKNLKHEIAFAQEAGFEGILMMLDDSESYMYLETIYDTEVIEDIVIENGWDENCVVLDFVNHSQQIICLEEAVA